MFRRPFSRQKLKTRVTREGLFYLAVLAFVLVGAVARDINLMIILAGMMIGPLVISWRWTALILSRLEVERKLPVGVGAGELLVVELSARNGRRRFASWAVAIEDPIHREQPAAPVSDEQPTLGTALIGHVPAGEVRSVTYRGRLNHRGKYRFGPIQASTRFPFGFISQTITLAEEDFLIVYPKPGRLGPGWNRLRQLSMTGKSRAQQRQGLTEGDFYGLRDWRAGDNKRWIHWRTSARRGGLMVRQFEQPRVQEFAILVDLTEPAKAGPGHARHVEFALSFAATIVADFCRRGTSQLLLAVSGRTPVVLRGTGSMSYLPDFLEKLAVAESHNEDHLPALLGKAVDELRPNMIALLITARGLSTADIMRAAGVRDDARKGSVLASMPIIDVSSETAAEYFHLDPDVAAAGNASPTSAA